MKLKNIIAIASLSVISFASNALALTPGEKLEIYDSLLQEHISDDLIRTAEETMGQIFVDDLYKTQTEQWQNDYLGAVDKSCSISTASSPSMVEWRVQVSQIDPATIQPYDKQKAMDYVVYKHDEICKEFDAAIATGQPLASNTSITSTDYWGAEPYVGKKESGSVGVAYQEDSPYEDVVVQSESSTVETAPMTSEEHQGKKFEQILLETINPDTLKEATDKGIHDPEYLNIVANFEIDDRSLQLRQVDQYCASAEIMHENATTMLKSMTAESIVSRYELRQEYSSQVKRACDRFLGSLS